MDDPFCGLTVTSVTIKEKELGEDVAAEVSIIINGALVIKGFRIVRNRTMTSGHQVLMPYTYYRDIAVPVITPITKDLEEYIKAAIMGEWDAKRKNKRGPA